MVQIQPATQVLQVTKVPTPIGEMLACAGLDGLYLLEFSDRPTLQRQLAAVQTQCGATIQPGENAHLRQIAEQLADYFAARRQCFSVPLRLSGTAFQCAVWRGLQAIPYGQTRSYKQQAAALGRPKAVRALANANGQNRMAIVIPCHRVIGADGSLTGYAGGLARKQFLLELERCCNSCCAD